MAKRTPNLSPEPAAISDADRQAAVVAAQRAAAILVGRFGARRVYLFGSLAGTGSLPFRADSDVDLAVEGLPDEVFWQALGAAQEVMPPRHEANVVCLEEVRPYLAQVIRTRGVVLADDEGTIHDGDAAALYDQLINEAQMEQPRWLLLAEEIEHELAELNEVVEEAAPLADPSLTSPTSYEIRAAGSMLHDFYNGAEHALRRIAVVVDEALPSDEHWHRTLLTQMAVPRPGRRPAVISADLRQRLDDYLHFRHVFRNVYSRRLEWPRLAKLLAALAEIHRDLNAALAAFCAYLRQHPAGVASPSGPLSIPDGEGEPHSHPGYNADRSPGTDQGRL